MLRWADMKKSHKYIFVTGGVMSGVGKGITTSSIGTIFQAKGYGVNIIKADPYLNVDAGTMNPTEHGEVFVLADGLETDQDMGNYERFLHKDTDSTDYMTSGMVYRSVIERERSLGYKGKCVEAIPHVRDEIIDRIKASGERNHSDISIIEIGGTVGDYQNIMFIEAARVLKLENPLDVAVIMVSYLPIPGTIGEMKTRPTQHAIHELNSYGIHADFIIARAEVPLDEKRKEKLAVSCNIRKERIISAPDIKSIYDVPLNFEKDKLGEMLEEVLHLKNKITYLSKWNSFAKSVHSPKKEIRIAVVGKYFDTGDFVFSDAYVSVIEALKFSAYSLGCKPVLIWMNAKKFEGGEKASSKLCDEQFKDIQGIIVPGGFGESGVEGKINVIRYAREKKIPYLGLCYGMQLMVIEYARNVAGMKGAHTTEIDKTTKYPVIDIMDLQKDKLERGDYGGTMRLGSYSCELLAGSIAEKAYLKSRHSSIKKSKKQALIISERHRHRFEVNTKFISTLTEKGLIFSGTSPDKKLMEIAELDSKDHPFFVGTQFHPEFIARPLAPHPLFTEFLSMSLLHLKTL